MFYVRPICPTSISGCGGAIPRVCPFHEIQPCSMLILLLPTFLDNIFLAQYGFTRGRLKSGTNTK